MDRLAKADSKYRSTKGCRPASEGDQSIQRLVFHWLSGR